MKKLKKELTFVLFFITFLGICTALPFILIQNNLVEPNIQKHVFPKPSQQEIDIITPGNKSYLEAMSGFYPATYGFESDTRARLPDWGTIAFVDTFYRDYSITYLWARVEAEWQGHRKILAFIDHQVNHYVYVRHESFNETSGTIEWFWGINKIGTNFGSYFRLMQSGTIACEINMDEGNFTCSDAGIIIPDVGYYDFDTWYHHKLSFDCSGAGNGRYTWVISYENGTQFAAATNMEFENNVDSIDTIHMESNFAGGSHRSYFDAFGLSWDPNYNLGDNLNEGLLLNFTGTIDFNWTGYSFDGQSIIPTFGNHTIPFPNDGPHTIQVFANDSMAQFYQSEIRHFMVDTIAPNSLISFGPYKDPNKVYKSTIFNITADDGVGSGISSIKYKINDSNLFDYSGSFSLFSYDYGDYIISYYAIDLAGHIEEENTLLVELVKKPSTPPTIPGYNIILLISIICIVSIVVFERGYKSINK